MQRSSCGGGGGGGSGGGGWALALGRSTGVPARREPMRGNRWKRWEAQHDFGLTRGLPYQHAKRTPGTHSSTTCVPGSYEALRTLAVLLQLFFRTRELKSGAILSTAVIGNRTLNIVRILGAY